MNPDTAVTESHVGARGMIDWYSVGVSIGSTRVPGYSSSSHHYPVC